MRTLTLLVAVAALAPLTAQAKHRSKADARVTFVEDEPMSPAATGSAARARDSAAASGTRMEVSIRAPEVTRAGETGDAVAHSAPTARADEAVRANNETNNEDRALMDELVARQMGKTRQNSASIDVCVADSVKRHPSGNGTVQLSVVVAANRVQSAHVVGDSVHDIELDGCLVKAALSWKLRLATATFVWPVTVSPSASR